MSDFDVIVVGSGCAGARGRLRVAASAGKSVLVVERGNFAGAKNMTGGRIYCHSLQAGLPRLRVRGARSSARSPTSASP